MMKYIPLLTICCTAWNCLKMKLICIISICLIFVSCKKESAYYQPYFTFDNIARKWFSGMKVHDTLRFLSNTGNVRIYEVNAIQNTKESVSGGCSVIGSCAVYYYYDKKFISFNRIDSFSTPTDIEISMQIPDSVDYTRLTKSVFAKTEIYGAFDDYNGQVLLFPDVYQNVSFSTFSNTIKTYNEILKFKSGIDTAFYNTGWNRKYTINEVWYDRTFGFVYFKDIYGQEWKRQN